MTPYRPIFRRALTLAAVCTLGGGVITLALAPVVSAAPVTRYVAEGGDNTNGASTNDCLIESKPCATIQHAISEAAPGDTIEIGAGTFVENVTIDKSLTLHGAGADNSTGTILRGDATDATNPVVTIDGVDATVTVSAVVTMGSGAATNTADGIHVDNAVAVSVVGSDIVGNGGVGIKDTHGTLTVIASTVRGNGSYGIWTDVGVTTTTVTDTAVRLNGDSGLRVSSGNATVADSTFNDNGKLGPAPEYGNGITFDSSITNAMTISGATVSGNSSDGVVSVSGTLTIDGSTIVSNGANGVLLDSNGGDCRPATITDTSIDTNALYGIDSRTGTLTVTTSTVTGNKAGGVNVGGTIGVGCTTTVTASTIADNGGIGATVHADSILDLNASTVARNASAGVHVMAKGTAEIYQSTIAGTQQGSAATQGGIVIDTGGVNANILSGKAAIGATIISGNHGADCAFENPLDSIVDAGYNLTSDSSCWPNSANGTLIGADARLGPLADNGGPTMTMALGDGSAALDKIPGPGGGPSPLRTLGRAFVQAIPVSIGDTCLAGGTTDQRGAARPINDKCDIGAYERQIAPPTGGGGTPSQTTTPTTSPTPTPTNSPSPAADSVPPSTTNSMSVTADPSQATMIAKTEVVGLAQTGVGIDRFAAAGILVLATGVLLLFGLAYRDVGRRH